MKGRRGFRWFPFFSDKPKRKRFRDSLPATAAAADPHHDEERAQFERVLRSFNISRVEDRLKILDVFLSTESHVTLAELEDLVARDAGELASRGFLAETMEMFCQFGFANKVVFENQEPRYEHQHLGDHHDHFICTRCGTIQEFVDPELEYLQQRIAARYRFHPLQHKMEVYGLCNGCMGVRDEVLPLHLAESGERVRVVALEGARPMLARLADLGLSEGVCLEIISNHPFGPVIVALKGSRLVIPPDLVSSIKVVHSCRHEEGGSAA